MNKLLPILQAEINDKGPLSVARYMELALGHEHHGYYQKQDPFGAQGDFITAPEISQMFGEIIGLWCAFVWQSLESPTPFHFVEVGPGRGTLMADALRAGQTSSGFLDAARLCLVETSPTLMGIQKQALASFEVTPTWTDNLEDIDDGPLLVIGNEFFDALPVRQYIRDKDGWRERLVGLHEDGSGLTFVLSKEQADQEIIPKNVRETAEQGAVYEDQSLSRALMSDIAARIVKFGGAALFIDYGHDQHGLGDTLQAVKTHKFVDVLADPGDQDLTTHVDFEQLSEAALRQGADVFGPMSQGVFLEQLGMSQRAEALKAKASVDQIFDVNRAYARLTSPEQMGSLFRVMAVAAPGLNLPPWSV